jgi:hypothetical protein
MSSVGLSLSNDQRIIAECEFGDFAEAFAASLDTQVKYEQQKTRADRI